MIVDDAVGLVAGAVAAAAVGLSTRDRARLHVVEMCCLNETFTKMLERATNASARAALYREALVDVVFRGFEELGVELSATRAHAAERGILQVDSKG